MEKICCEILPLFFQFPKLTNHIKTTIALKHPQYVEWIDFAWQNLRDLSYRSINKEKGEGINLRHILYSDQKNCVPCM